MSDYIVKDTTVFASTYGPHQSLQLGCVKNRNVENKIFTWISSISQKVIPELLREA